MNEIAEGYSQRSDLMSASFEEVIPRANRTVVPKAIPIVTPKLAHKVSPAVTPKANVEVVFAMTSFGTTSQEAIDARCSDVCVARVGCEAKRAACSPKMHKLSRKAAPKAVAKKSLPVPVFKSRAPKATFPGEYSRRRTNVTLGVFPK